MSKLFFLCLMIMMIGVASAATFRGKVGPKPAHLAHKEGCYMEAIEDVIPYGDAIAPIGKDCMRIECNGSSRLAEWLSYATCGVVFTEDPKCHVTEMNLKKPYPHCCPTIKCDTDNHV